MLNRLAPHCKASNFLYTSNVSLNVEISNDLDYSTRKIYYSDTDLVNMDYTKIVEKIKPSIALIVCLDERGKAYSTGSGFIFSKKEIIATCNHVIEKATTVVVKFTDSDDFLTAKVVMRDDEHDLALLKFSNDTRKPLLLADIGTIKEGMPVIFSGYPLQMQHLTTHRGMLSSIAKDSTGITTYLIDGTVNSGNSGCPLVNTNGELIGVVNAKRMERAELLREVEQMQVGALALHGIDLVELYQALINNVQLGIGYAVPASYIPEHKTGDEYLTSRKPQIEEFKSKANKKK